MGRKYKLYNPTKKDEYLATVKAESSKEKLKTMLNRIAPYEFLYDKDLSDFTDEETIKVAYLIPILLMSERQLFFRVVNEYREFCGEKQIAVPTEKKYKLNYINEVDKNDFPWVLNDRDLFDSIVALCANEKYDNFMSGYLQMPTLYKLLQFYGLTDDVILSIKRESFLKDFVLPNGKIIVDETLKTFITNLCNMANFTFRFGDGRIRNMRFCITDQLVRSWENFDISDNTPATVKETGLSEVSNIKTALTSRVINVPSLQFSYISEAGQFNEIFIKDIINSNRGVALSKLDLDKLILPKSGKSEISIHGLSRIMEEKYNIYKAYRLKSIPEI